MDDEDYEKTIDDLLYLCRCAINGFRPVKREYDLNNLFRVANRNMLTSMVGIALKNAGIEDLQFKQAIAAAYRKTVILNHERDILFVRLSEAGIWHMALKGTIIRDWYPEFGMRESADCDVLFDKTYEEKVRDIMGELGYTMITYGGGHHDVYFKKPVTNMQMHVALFGVGFEKRLNDYYENVGERLVGDGFEKQFKPEDFYVYVIAHNHRDYSTSGTGLRSLIDTYVILKKFSEEFNWEYINAETEKLKIKDFEEKNRSLALHLFGPARPLSDSDKAMLTYLVRSGTYGTVENVVKNKTSKYGGGRIGKIRYIRERLFLPIDVIEHSFPLAYKYKILIPFLPLYRALNGLTKNWMKIKAEVDALVKND